MKYFRFFICFVLVGIVVFSFTIGYKKIDNEYIYKENGHDNFVLSLWQVDTFEGGKGSRKQFLNKIALDFERKNQGVFIMAVDMTIDGVQEKFNKNEFPDLISYGVGVDLSNAKIIDTDNSVKGGLINGNTFASAWCKGGYFLIKNNSFHSKRGVKNNIIIVK